MIRSLFFAPANRPELVLKFPRFGADCCVIDLEDGTPPGEKRSAREALAQTVAQVRAAGLGGTLMVRVNVPDSEHYLADLEAAFASDIDGVVVPKVETTEQVFRELGYAVSRNKPYAGGFITEHYGDPATGLHALQIEVNRALYMDEALYEKTAAFHRLRADLGRMIEAVAHFALAETRPLPDAAE